MIYLNEQNFSCKFEKYDINYPSLEYRSNNTIVYILVWTLHIYQRDSKELRIIFIMQTEFWRYCHLSFTRWKWIITHLFLSEITLLLRKTNVKQIACWNVFYFKSKLTILKAIMKNLLMIYENIWILKNILHFILSNQCAVRLAIHYNRDLNKHIVFHPSASSCYESWCVVVDEKVDEKGLKKELLRIYL